ncbi:MAG: phage major capsid protein [Ruminiclostridium sp.]
MAIKNLDEIKQKKQELVSAMSEAFREQDETKMSEALENFGNFLEEQFMAEAKGLIASADNAVLSARGSRALTSEERKFYQSIIDAKKSGAPMQAISNLVEAFPNTVITDVLSTVKREHPLLDLIDFRNTTGVSKWIIDDSEAGGAGWGALGSKITTEADGAIKLFDVMLCKLTAYFPMHNDFYDLGPEWLDAYIRQILAEYLVTGTETGIVAGTGKDMPVGMCKDVSEEAVITGGVYSDKTPVKVKDFSPETYSALLSELATDRKGNARKVDNLVLVVNPKDYFGKIFPATTLLKPDGTYAHDVFPYTTTVIQSVAVEEGKAIIGMPKRYLMCLGTGKGGKIESDEGKSQFLDDVTVLKIKLYGNGRPKDNNSFLVLDISEVERTYLVVKNIDVTPAAAAATVADTADTADTAETTGE